MSEGSLQVTAAVEAHYARGQSSVPVSTPATGMIQSGTGRHSWYLLRIHQTLSHQLPGSRFYELL